MPAQPLPTPEEARSLVPKPGSVLWRFGSDARIMAGAGYALVLQVGHPTVAAGVREHSNFAADPWGRLLRTLDYTTVMVYGGPEAAAATGGRLREMHTHIKGITPDGRPYSALEPEAYAWVHATLVDAIVRGHEMFGQPLERDQVDELYADWLAIGRIIGVDQDQLPEDWDEFGAYFDGMVNERLESSDVVQDVLATFKTDIRPPVRMLNDPAWRVIRLPIGRVGALATIGMLPPALRERLGLRWSRGKALELRALGAASRRATRAMPRSLRNFGPAYLRWRERERAKGGSGDSGRTSVPSAA